MPLIDVKTSVDIPTHHQLRRKAELEGRKITEVVRRAIIKDLTVAPVTITEAVVERAECSDRRGSARSALTCRRRWRRQFAVSPSSKTGRRDGSCGI